MSKYIAVKLLENIYRQSVVGTDTYEYCRDNNLYTKVASEGDVVYIVQDIATILKNKPEYIDGIDFFKKDPNTNTFYKIGWGSSDDFVILS